MSSDGLDQAEILECEVGFEAFELLLIMWTEYLSTVFPNLLIQEAFLETLEKLGIQHDPNNKIFLQTFSEVRWGGKQLVLKTVPNFIGKSCRLIAKVMEMAW